MNFFKSQSSIIAFMLVTSSLLVFLTNCTSKNIEIEKEKLIYRDKMDTVLTKIDRKLVALEEEHKRVREIQETETEELAEPELDIDSLETQIVLFERLEDKLNQKLGEIGAVSDENWSQLKSEIDQLIAEYQETIVQTKKDKY